MKLKFSLIKIELKNYCEELEKRLSELRAEQEFKATSAAPKDTNNNQRESATKLPASSEDVSEHSKNLLETIC